MEEGFPIRKMVNFSGVCEDLVQIRSPAVIEATRMEQTSIWQPNEAKTWFRLVLALDIDVCSNSFVSSGFTMVRSGFPFMEEA